MNFAQFKFHRTNDTSRELFSSIKFRLHRIARLPCIALLWFFPGFDKERERDFQYFFSRNIRENSPASPPPLSLSIYICFSIAVLPPSASLLSRSGRKRRRERERERDLGRMRPLPPPPPFSGLHPVCPHSLSRSRHGRFCSERVYTPSSKEEVLQTLPSSAQYLVRKKRRKIVYQKRFLRFLFMVRCKLQQHLVPGK